MQHNNAHGLPQSSPKWVQGFTNKSVGFVNSRTICYPCGNYIIFINIITRDRSFLKCHTGGIGAFAVNPNQHVVAFSDRQLNPVIYIYNFQGLKKVAKLTGQASLDYSLLAFSHAGPYLASYSSLPDFSLSIWDWHKKVVLCSQSQPGVEVTAMSFNPMSWHQLCLHSGTSVTIWTIERNNEEHILKSKPVKLPTEDGSIVDEQNSFFSRPSVSDPYFGPVLPNSAIAGLVGDEAETFRPKDDIQPCVHPTVHCWTPASELYMGCEEGYFLKIGADTFKAVLVNPKSSTDTKAKRRATFRSLSQASVKGQAPAKRGAQNVVLLAMALHKDGLYAAGNSVAESGEVHIWQLDDGAFVSKMCLHVLVTAMACSLSSHCVAVGTGKGHVYFIDVTEVETPRVIHRVLLSEIPVQFIHYEQSGQFLITSNINGQIFVLNAFPSKLFEILGCVEMSSEIIDLTSLYDIEKDTTEVIVLLCPPEIKRARVEIFNLHANIISENEKCITERGMLKENKIRRRAYELDFSLYSLVKRKDGTVLGYTSQAPFICKYHLSAKITWKDQPISLSEKKTPSKQFGHAFLYLSPHGKWLASVAESGIVFIHDASSMDVLAREYCHSYHGRGIKSFAFSLDSQYMLACGSQDGALVCLKWKKLGERKTKDAVDFGSYLLTMFNSYIFRENLALRNMTEWTAASKPQLYESASSQIRLHKTSGIELTEEDEYFLLTQAKPDEIAWIDQKAQKAIKDESSKFAEKRKEVKLGIKELRKKVCVIDLLEYFQKLCRGIALQFIQNIFCEIVVSPLLASPKQSMIVTETICILDRRSDYHVSEQEIQVRKDIEMENLANRYIREIIKHECWDAMSVKGRSVKTFHSPCEVQNYPMRERTPEEQQMLDRVLYLKKIEAIDLKVETLYSSFPPNVSSSTCVLYMIMILDVSHNEIGRLNKVRITKIIYNIK
ncbi:hypothetical protein JD844_006884 [Phrynosoma platyrhinos]|uniref:Cilia- and flagella-associated protein 43 n=1 Tax=Phrynosoma platyrhinos TaxID=52577 RepID=A0ABQ7T3C6_PHRPL|nr:hypothetical protein JD844_006884 [Phrynosoma platyrhinos]